MNSNTNPVTAAQTLMANHSKLELVAMARGFGWRGDHARAPVLQLALFVAMKLSEEDKTGNGQQAPDQGQAQSPEQGQQAQQDQSPEQAQQDQDQAQQDQDQAQQDQAQQDQSPEQAQQSPEQAQQDQAPEQAQQAPEQAPEQAQQAPEQAQQAPDQDDDDQQEPESPEPDEFENLLKSSGIKHPHRMLHKLWLLTAKAKRNVILHGPAGTGKTMLSEQLAKLLGVDYGIISCTGGMDESEVTGWLLPGKKMKFEYVESPFVNLIQKPSVFMLDELDGADANTALVFNSVLSNGVISIAKRRTDTLIRKHQNNIVVSGVNTLNGATMEHTGRNVLDGATMDRFYPLAVDYDMTYIKSLFDVSRKTPRRSAKWKPAAIPDQFGMDAIREKFLSIMSAVQRAKIPRTFATRAAQNITAAAMVGIPAEEIFADITAAWSDDEKMRAGV